MGVPIVGLVTKAFHDLVKSYAYKKGMPNIRLAFVPHPITGVPAAVVRKYLQGNDPVTGKPILDEVVAGLTSPLTAEDKATGFVERPIPRLYQGTGSEDRSRGWSKEQTPRQT